MCNNVFIFIFCAYLFVSLLIVGTSFDKESAGCINPDYYNMTIVSFIVLGEIVTFLKGLGNCNALALYIIVLINSNNVNVYLAW